MINNVSFKANYIKSARFYETNDNKMKMRKVSFVEFSPENPNDLLALNNSGARGLMKYKDIDWQPLIPNVKWHTYGLTTQLDNFDSPDSKKILGVVTVYEDKNANATEITSIRVCNESRKTKKMPAFLKFLNDKIRFCNTNERNFNNVGAAMLMSLKSIYDNLSVKTSRHTRSFFENNGFQNCIPNSKRYLKWIKV